jgi:hypothetical protein
MTSFGSTAATIRGSARLRLGTSIMTRPLFALALALVAPSAYAQLPAMSGGGKPFDGSIFQTQAQTPAPAADLSPAATLTGEAPPPRKIWSGSAEAGFTGQSGNTDVVNVRSGFNAQRKTDENLFVASLLYSLAKQEGLTTQNQALLTARDELLFPGSPWSLFGQTNVEWDEFRVYDLLVGVYAGIGYTVIDDGSTLFKLRSGLGAVRRFGGPDDQWIPEALSGFDFNHRFSDRQSFLSSLDYYPRLDQFGQYRIRARAAYEIVVDPATGTALRFGAQSRYDSDPGPAKRHDLNYFASLVFNF